MHPLDGSLLKASRAELHLKALQRSIGRFLNRYPYSVSQHNAGDYREYFIQRDGALPKTWGLLVGDFAHNLRSALDHIAYEFNIRTRRPIAQSLCQFPIFDTRAGYYSRGKGMFPNHPSGVKTLINNLQPYHRRKRPELQLLSFLRDLDNADKHRTITPIFDDTTLEFTKQFSNSDFVYETLSYPFNLDFGGYRVILTSRVQKHLGIKLNPQLAVEIVFEITERRTNIVRRIGVSTLQSIYVFVHKDIIPRFTDFFVKSPKGWRTKPIRHV